MYKNYFHNKRKTKSPYLSIIIILIVYLTPLHLFSQIENCDNLYVWPFKTKINSAQNGPLLEDLLTNEIEDILISSDSCIILQRRNYARLSSQIEIEKDIESIENISSKLLQEFKHIGAKYVLFGEINQDMNFNLSLRLTVESLITKEIKASKTIYIDAEKLIKREERQKYLESDVKKYLLKINKTEAKSSLFKSISKLGIRVNSKGCKLFSNTLECTFSVDSLRQEKIIIPQKGNLINPKGNDVHNKHSKTFSSIIYNGKSYSNEVVYLNFNPSVSNELSFIYHLNDSKSLKPGILTVNINGIGFDFPYFVILN